MAHSPRAHTPAAQSPAAGAPVATLSEIARQAGVSVSVVSRVLNGDPTVRTREETRQRVLRVAKDLNYTANYAGRALRLARSKALALITPAVSSPLFSDLLAGATGRGRSRGLHPSDRAGPTASRRERHASAPGR